MQMRNFTYVAHPARVLFGSGIVKELPREIERLGAKRALVLTTPAQEADGQALVDGLGQLSVGLFSGATMHTPVDISDFAADRARQLKADVVVALGGGSTTGLSKAIALRTGLPQIVLPTTYAGSEMTPIIGETANGEKRTQNTPKVLPQVVLYDVDMTMALPPSISATSGMNAIAHAVEALYAREQNPIVDAMALEAIRSLSMALPAIVENPNDKTARSEALYGAWLCGICLGSVGMALHHKLCHTLGGTFNLPHAETHTVILPHALAYNSPTIPDVIAKLQPILGTNPASGLYDLGRSLKVPLSLAELGMPQDGIDRALNLALSNPYWNPRRLESAPLRELLVRAYAGEKPASH